MQLVHVPMLLIRVAVVYGAGARVAKLNCSLSPPTTPTTRCYAARRRRGSMRALASGHAGSSTLRVRASISRTSTTCRSARTAAPTCAAVPWAATPSTSTRRSARAGAASASSL